MDETQTKHTLSDNRKNLTRSFVERFNMNYLNATDNNLFIDCFKIDLNAEQGI